MMRVRRQVGQRVVQSTGQEGNLARKLVARDAALPARPRRHTPLTRSHHTVLILSPIAIGAFAREQVAPEIARGRVRVKVGVVVLVFGRRKVEKVVEQQGRHGRIRVVGVMVVVGGCVAVVGSSSRSG